jgi:hypothetical protein
VPLTPHVLPSTTAHRLSADIGQPIHPHSAQPKFVPSLSAPPDDDSAGDSSSSSLAAAGSQGRLRMASASSGSGEAATPAAPATAGDRRKSLLSP